MCCLHLLNIAWTPSALPPSRTLCLLPARPCMPSWHCISSLKPSSHILSLLVILYLNHPPSIRVPSWYLSVSFSWAPLWTFEPLYLLCPSCYPCPSLSLPPVPFLAHLCIPSFNPSWLILVNFCNISESPLYYLCHLLKPPTPIQSILLYIFFPPLFLTISWEWETPSRYKVFMPAKVTLVPQIRMKNHNLC